jgi:hypothetical protein
MIVDAAFRLLVPVGSLDILVDWETTTTVKKGI